MGNTTTVTQTFHDATDDGFKIYNVMASTVGDASSAAIAIPITKLKKAALGTPGFSIIYDNQVAKAYVISQTASGTTITITLNAVIENAKTVKVSAKVFGY